MNPPVGRHLHWVARVIQRGFNDALEEAGGSLPIWLVLLSIELKDFDTQQELAKAVGIEGPTLTHHLDAMERDELVRRRRDPDNRRAVRVELTPKGRRLFEKLRAAAVAFDEKLRSGLSDGEVAKLRDQLTQMAENVSR
jgi:MarR family transcriptional regulator, transcriptional regulator for hemolysin